MRIPMKSPVNPVHVVQCGAKRRWLRHYKSGGRQKGGGAGFPLRITRQIEAIGAVNDVVEDAVTHGRVRKPGEPLISEKPLRMQRLIFRAFAEDLISNTRAEELLGTALDPVWMVKALKNDVAAPGINY